MNAPTDELARKRRAAAAFIQHDWHLILLGPTRLPLKNCELCNDDPKNPAYIPHTGVADCPHGADICHGHQAGSNNFDHVMRLLDRYPLANFGIAAGPSNLVVVDLDTNKRNAPTPEKYQGLPGIIDGCDVFAYALERYGARWPEDTLAVGTPTPGGLHLYWSLKPGTVITSSNNGQFGWLIDVRSSGSYVPAPGSVVRGGRYRRLGDVIDPAPAPAWLLHHLTVTGHVPAPPKPRTPFRFRPRPGADRIGQERLGRIADQLVTAPPHTGHAALCTATTAAAHLVSDGLVGEVDAEDTIFAAGRSRNRDEREIRDAWRTALNKAGTGAR
jgi:Bifunctional DNA primase/polymerase, N-terminal